MKAPTEFKNQYDLYDFLAYSEPYDDETEIEFTDRQCKFNELQQQMNAAGMTIDHLAGVLEPDIDVQRIQMIDSPKITPITPQLASLLRTSNRYVQ